MSPRKVQIFAHDSSSLFLPWMVLLMVFMATLTLAGSLSLGTMLDRWNRAISGSLTVQIMPPSDGVNSVEEVSRNLEAALVVLRDTPGVLDVRPLSEGQLRLLLKPWLGQNELIDDLPLPRLIDVTVDDTAQPDLDKLQADLAKHAPRASIDVHRMWMNKLVSLGNGLKMLATAVLMLVIFTTSATVVYATLTSFAVHKPVIELLHLMGARDDYIARQFSRRAMLLGLGGGVVGLTLAVPAIIGIGTLAQKLEGGLISEASLGPPHWVALVSVPMAGALLATLTAHLTVHRTLRRMP